MTTRVLAALLLKLCGVLLVLRQVGQMAISVWTLLSQNQLRQGSNGDPSDGISLMLISLTGFFTLLGVLLIVRGDDLAARLVPHDAPVPAADTMPPATLMQIGLACVGALLASEGAAGLADWGVRFGSVIRSGEYANFSSVLGRVGPTEFVEPGVRLVVGLTLLLAPAWVMARLRLPR